MLYTPIKNLGNNFNAVQFSFMAIECVFSVLDSKPAIKEILNSKPKNKKSTTSLHSPKLDLIPMQENIMKKRLQKVSLQEEPEKLLQETWLILYSR